MNASDRRALKRIAQLDASRCKDGLLRFTEQFKVRRIKKPIQKVREAKEQKERLSKKEKRARVRAYVFSRANGYCELSGAPGPTEWHHLLSGNGRRQQQESVQNTMAVTQAAHIAYHRAPSSFAETVKFWCLKYDYPQINRIEHAALPRKSSRASGLGQRVPPSPASSPDARDLPKGPRCPFYEGKPGCDRAVCPKPPPCEPLSTLEEQRSESP